jgi:hypothetical protein
VTNKTRPNPEGYDDNDLCLYCRAILSETDAGSGFCSIECYMDFVRDAGYKADLDRASAELTDDPPVGRSPADFDEDDWNIISRGKS